METNNQQPDDKMMRYLDGELSGKDLQDFEKSLAESPAMMTELDNLRLAKLAVEHYGLKQQVGSVHKQMMAEFNDEVAKTSRPKLFSLMRVSMRVAAALLTALVLFGGYQYVVVSSSKLLPAGNYELSVTRGEAAVSPIEKYYQDKDYNKVISEYQKSRSADNELLLLAGISYYKTGQAGRAIPEFKKITGNTATDNYRDDAEYYLALSYLGINEPANAKIWLEKIYKDKDHLYHDKVTWWTMLRLKMLIAKNPGK